MRVVFCISFLLLIVTKSYAQTTDCNQHVSYFKTRDPEKLARSLTRNLSDDSAKVYAIHCWITHHIKYDVKKFQAFDFARVPVKTILRKRKAVCTGYSDLFNELCKHAKIPSTNIPGYTKNVHVDVNDKFYLEDHEWNAVFIHNEWKLVDACWDAGYIHPFKKTFYGHILSVFSLGNASEVKYKPHFKRYPTDEYFCKSGYRFISDHIPSDPIWQLMDVIRSIEQTEHDSSYYLSSMVMPEGPPPAPNDQRLSISQLSQKDKDVYEGPATYEYNPKNHYRIGMSYLIQARDMYHGIDAKSTDTTVLFTLCNQNVSELNKATEHFDAALFFLYQQKEELNANNHKKNEILKTQNRYLMSSSKTVLANLNSGKHIQSTAKGRLKSISKTSNSQYKRLNKSTRFEKARQYTQYAAIDSAICQRNTAFYRDSLLWVNQDISNHFLLWDSLYHSYANLFNQYSMESVAYGPTTLAIITSEWGRMFYYDDLDYEIRSIKDTLMMHKLRSDFLLLTDSGEFIFKSLLKETARLRMDFRDLCRYHRQLANEYVKLKKYHVAEQELSIQYANNINQFAEELSRYTGKLNGMTNSFNSIKRACEKQIKPATKEYEAYLLENYIESKMFASRARYINSQYTAFSNLSRGGLNECEKIRNKIDRIKSKHRTGQ